MGKTLTRIRPFRRVLQVLVVAVLVAVPVMTANSMEWSPSRIVLGQIPSPVQSEIAGDTWHFKAWGFRLVHPVAFVESALAFKTLYVPMLWAVALPLLITVLLGRMFCSWLCPVGFVLELNQKLHAALGRMGIGWRFGIRDFRYILLGASLVFAFFFAFPLISVFDPPHVLGRELMYGITHQQVSLSGMGLLLGIFLFEALAVSRAWCRFFCPSGGGLALLGKPRMLRIRLNSDVCDECGSCNAACPYKLTPMVIGKAAGFDWATCDNCGLCRDACPEGAITYGIGSRKEQ